MNLIKTIVTRRRVRYGALRKNTVQETKSTAYLCPACKKVVSYIPMPSIKRCTNCNQPLDWEGAKEALCDGDSVQKAAVK